MRYLWRIIWILKKFFNKFHWKFYCCTHTKQSKAPMECSQSSVTHLDPSETLQESWSWRWVVPVKMNPWGLHARDQEQTMMSSCALTGVDLNPQLQHQTSKTDKSVIDHWSIWYQWFHHWISPLELLSYLHVCVCVSVCDSKTRQSSSKTYPPPSQPSNLHVCVHKEKQ